MSDANTRSVDLTVHIDAPIETVWSMITDPGEIARWLAPSATSQSGQGGYIEVSWGEGMTGRNTIKTWQPPQHLLMGNADAGLDEDYTLTSEAGGTVLRLHHSGFPATPDGEAYQRSLENGWRAFFAMLRHGAQHAGQPYKNVTLFRQLGGSRDEAWNSLARPGGLTKEGLPRVEAGQTYEVELFNGSKIRGTVLHSVWPGYLVLSAANLDDSVLALLCEGGPTSAMLTITWILNGKAATQEAEFKGVWQRWSEQ